jgi:stearoyl-CoA desaturase (delta-9 desaturase)
MTATTQTTVTVGTDERGPKPLTEGKQPAGILVGLWSFVIIPLIAFVAAIPVAWGGWLGWTDRRDLHSSLLHVGLRRDGRIPPLPHAQLVQGQALAACDARRGWQLAIEGSPTQWVADHRRHHQFSDLEGDPHSPWRYGDSMWGLTKGLFHAHVGWLFHRDMSNRARFAPDLMADKDIQKVDRIFPWLVALSAIAPAIVGGLVTMSWQGALTAFFWAGLVRIGLLHHVTWRSTRSATSTASARSRCARATRPPTSGRWPSCPSARAGTTCTTPTRPAPVTV